MAPREPENPSSSLERPGRVARADAEHYQWGERCDGWHLLKCGDLSVIEERVPPGAGEVRHAHTRARQFFYILRGQARIEIDGGAFELSAGQGTHVPPGCPHRFFNPGSEDVEFLVISSPPTAGDRTNLG